MGARACKTCGQRSGTVDDDGACFFCRALVDVVDLRVGLARLGWALVRFKGEEKEKKEQKKQASTPVNADLGGRNVDEAKQILRGADAARAGDGLNEWEGETEKRTMHAVAVVRAHALGVSPATFDGTEYAALRRLLRAWKPTEIASAVFFAASDPFLSKTAIPLARVEPNMAAWLSASKETKKKPRAEVKADLHVERRALIEELRTLSLFEAFEVEQIDPAALSPEGLADHCAEIRRKIAAINLEKSKKSRGVA